jgi:4-hydroxy-3-methylbut-2-enyl diphosphate reductase
MLPKPSLTVLMASPRGFCAGVDRAILIVERALEKYGPPVYVRHEIVHNRHVVQSLRDKGAVFVDDLQGIPTDRPVVFSAHGVSKAVVGEAEDKALFTLDATCPLVSKVHHEVLRWHSKGHHIIFIGHRGHPEVEGTMGQVPAGAMTLVETVADVADLSMSSDTPMAYATQTTLSVDETMAIVAALRARYPDLQGPKKEDICYATTNRQEAVKRLAPLCDMFLVVGSTNSSNSRQLVQVAMDYGCPRAVLLDTPDPLQRLPLVGGMTVGLSAGASAPESLVQDILRALQDHFSVETKEQSGMSEGVSFRLPVILEGSD